LEALGCRRQLILLAAEHSNGAVSFHRPVSQLNHNKKF